MSIVNPTLSTCPVLLSLGADALAPCSRQAAVRTFAAKELHFNRTGETLKRMQAGVDKLASVVGVTLGPKVSAVHLHPAVVSVLHLMLKDLGAGKSACNPFNLHVGNRFEASRG